MEFEYAYVELSGHRTHYVRAGLGAPLVLIHGIVGSSANWKWNIPVLAEHATVYALDLLEMGRSERMPKLEAGLEETARRILATMDALEIGQADVAAASHGGAVAMMMAALAPARVRGLILFAPANPYSTKADWMLRVYSSALGRAVARLAPALPRRIHQVALGRMFGDPERIPNGCLDAYRETLKVPGSVAHVLRIVRLWFSDMEKLRKHLPKIGSTPTLLIWGDKDRVVSLESGRRLERELAAELAVIPGGGHLVFEEFPKKVNQVIVDWLERRRNAKA